MARLAVAVALAALAHAAGNELIAAGGSVTVYEGPTECDEADKAKSGDRLYMHYTGTIDKSSKAGTPGSQFDSSRDRDQTFDFNLGAGEVIQGWDKGLVGLCRGAKATLVIPPDFGYGEDGAGDDIPGGATLNFDIEVVDIGPADEEGEQENLFAVIDTDADGKLTKEEVEAYFREKNDGMKVPDELWESEDQDKDGVISWEEFTGPKGEKQDL